MTFKLQQTLTEKELTDFLEQTAEFKIKKISEDKYELNHEDGSSLIIYKPTFQTLIRHIFTIGWNTAKGIK